MQTGNKHIGSSLDELLAEDGSLDSASATATERVIAWQVATGKRDLFTEISDGFSALADARAHRLTLRTHQVAETDDDPEQV